MHLSELTAFIILREPLATIPYADADVKNVSEAVSSPTKSCQPASVIEMVLPSQRLETPVPQLNWSSSLDGLVAWTNN